MSAIVAGSGITPIMSIIRTVLTHEPKASVVLIYGNRTTQSIIFREALEDVKDRFMGRFTVHHVLSREKQEIACSAAASTPPSSTRCCSTLCRTAASITRFCAARAV